MSKYPEIITEDVLQKVSHVDDATIRQDIADTGVEISALKKEVEGYRLLVQAQHETMQGKLNAFRHDATIGRIERRREFIRFLNAVLAARKEKNTDGKANFSPETNR